MKINYCLNTSANVRNKDGKRVWVKKIHKKETMELNTLEELRYYLDEKRCEALNMIPKIEKEIKSEYDFPKNFHVVATYPRVFTSPKNNSDGSKDMEFLISFKVLPKLK